MSELKISEVILRERRKLKLTQEELSTALSVSAQAVSNWERGGYPDITMLPAIANFFKISVDELIGNDEASRKADISSFSEKCMKLEGEKKLNLCKEYYKKYPHNEYVCNNLIETIETCEELWESEYPLLNEVCQKIIDECTDEFIRQRAFNIMTIVCPEDELEKWNMKNTWLYDMCQNECLEERFRKRNDTQKYNECLNSNNLITFLHFIGRNYARELNNYPRTPEVMLGKMRILKSISDDETVPEAFGGLYAHYCLKAAGAYFALDENEKGFELFEEAVNMYRVWDNIPDGRKMSVGSKALFGDMTITKVSGYSAESLVKTITNNNHTLIPYFLMFYHTSTLEACNFVEQDYCNNVRDTERFKQLYFKLSRIPD